MKSWTIFGIVLIVSQALTAPLDSTSDAATSVRKDVGTVTVHNNCVFDIGVIVVANGVSEGFETIAAGTRWSQQQQSFGGVGQGVSVKLNKIGDSPDNVAQVEYTVDGAALMVFYDLSLINGNPFKDQGQRLTSDGAGPEIDCEAGEQPCSSAYTFSSEIATKAAPQGTDLHYYICLTRPTNFAALPLEYHGNRPLN